ncbi:MAG: nucleotidyltransferase family protein [Peptococcaceae bacterium]|jgi:predicted nucleotidyltransferase|nr:nucleotidyltransferase family protein [Peptococcaceae bacterium]MDH7525837.1 nucleotidyltransferase family protein [Peptococcaceae bacterium]
MLNKEIINEKLKKNKAVLKEKYHVERIGVFGSFARNEQTDDSDIDILVEFSKPVGFEFIDLKFYLEELFNKKVDLTTVTALKPRIKDKILNRTFFSIN